MALNTVSIPFGYYPDPTKGRPVFNGSIYIGEPDLDPTILANQKTITIRQEGVDTPSVAQPIATSAGGVPTYNGSPAEILVDGSYSMAVLNSSGAQVYYVASQNDSVSMAGSDQRYGPIFATVAAMTAANPVSLDGVEVSAVAGMKLTTTGSLTSGDDGAADYLVVAGDSSNGTNRLLLANGNTAVLQSAGPANVKQYLTPSDGIASAIAGITAARSESKAVYFPPGSYLFDVDSPSLFDKETHLIFADGAKLTTSTGVAVRGNSCTVEGNLTQHFQSDDYDTQWLTATAYTTGDIVQFEYGRYFKALSDHTSGTWTTDKLTKWAAFQPFAFFQRADGDQFVYPEWFGAKADNTTPASVGWAQAISCNNVISGLSLIDSGGSLVNGYYKLDRPFVFLNGRTVIGGEAPRAYLELRLDGISGDVGFVTEEVESAPANGFGYSSMKNIRFGIENIVNVNFQWCKFYFLETARFEQCTWQSYGVCTVKQIAEFLGGPVSIPDLNMMYDDGTDLIVEDYPLYLNLFNGLRMGNINYQVPGAKKGLKIRPGKMCEIDTIFHETSPTTIGEASLYIDQSGSSNGSVKSCFLQNKEVGALAIEIFSNTGLSSFVSNFKLLDIHTGPHDGVGLQFDNIVKINGVNYPKSDFDTGTPATFLNIKEISKDRFSLSGLRAHYADGPVPASYFFPTVGGSATVSIPFSPVLKQGVGNNLSWCGMIQICGRGAAGIDDRGYLAFVSLAIRGDGTNLSTVTELAGAGRWTIVWNSGTQRWDITNNIVNSINEARIGFIQQGPSLLVQ